MGKTSNHGQIRSPLLLKKIETLKALEFLRGGDEECVLLPRLSVCQWTDGEGPPRSSCCSFVSARRRPLTVRMKIVVFGQGKDAAEQIVAALEQAAVSPELVGWHRTRLLDFAGRERLDAAHQLASAPSHQLALRRQECSLSMLATNKHCRQKRYSFFFTIPQVVFRKKTSKCRDGFKKTNLPSAWSKGQYIIIYSLIRRNNPIWRDNIVIICITILFWQKKKRVLRNAERELAIPFSVSQNDDKQQTHHEGLLDSGGSLAFSA